MYGILASALAFVGSSFLRTVALKGVMFGLLFFLVQYVGPILITFTGMGHYFSSLVSEFNLSSAGSGGFFYFTDLFRVGTGLSMVLTAMVTKFLIRRIPFIG